MNRAAGYVAFFVLGFVICALAMHLFLAGQGGSATIQTVSCPHPGMKVVGSNQVADAAALVSKYVVSIDTVGKTVTATPNSFFGFPIEPQQVIPEGHGSGVIIDPNGYIVTNNHVVADTTNMAVTTNDGHQYEARLIGRDPKTDIAVIKIGASGLEAAKFGDSDSLRVGDWVIAVGNPLAIGTTVTAGIISATKRGPIQVENEVLENVLQTDAAINRGNSGGALADLNGDLIGINAAIASAGPGGGNIGIGFAIPSSTAKRVATDLIKNGRVIRPWLGISYMPYNANSRKLLARAGIQGLPDNLEGAIIEPRDPSTPAVTPGSPAAAAGLKQHDIIARINGKPVSGTAKPQKGKVTIADEITASRVGQRITLEVWRYATRRVSTVSTRLTEMPLSFLDHKSTAQPNERATPFPFGP